MYFFFVCGFIRFVGDEMLLSSQVIRKKKKKKKRGGFNDSNQLSVFPDAFTDCSKVSLLGESSRGHLMFLKDVFEC